MHDLLTRDHHISEGSDRSFGLVFAAVFLLVAVWPLFQDFSAFAQVRLWALAIAVLLVVVSLVRPVLLAPANRLWIRFGLLLSRVLGPVILMVMYFVVLTPVALVMRLTGKDLLHLKPEKSQPTYWLPRDQERAGSMRDQF